jgi:hypothetical protein
MITVCNSSISIEVISYKLDEHGSIPNRDFYFRCRVITGYWFQQPFCAVGIAVCFPWLKCEADIPHLSALTPKFYDPLLECAASFPSTNHRPNYYNYTFGGAVARSVCEGTA